MTRIDSVADKGSPATPTQMGTGVRALSTQTWMAATFVLVATTLASKVLGFGRDVLVANFFGASAQVDAFMVASTLSTIAGGIGSALAAAYVPVYRRVLVASGSAEAGRLAGGAVGFAFVVTGVVIAIFTAVPRFFVQLVAPALPEPTMMLAAELLRWLAGLMLGINMIYILAAVYNALEHFTIPSVMDLASNVVVLLALWLLAQRLGIRALAVGLGVGTLVVTAAMTVPIATRRLAALNFRFWQSAAVRELAVLALPVLLWELVSQAGGMVENFFGARLEAGSIAALGYAKRLSVLVVSLLAVNIARAVFPILTRLVAEARVDEARDLLLKLSRQYVVAFVPLSVGLMYFRRDVVTIAFMRGAFDEAAVATTSVVLLYYAAGIVLLAAIPIAIRTCYAFADTQTPLMASAMALLAAAGLNAILVPHLGIAGIALSTSLSLVLSVAMMVRVVRSRLGGLGLRHLLTVLSVSIFCSVVALLPLVVLRWAMPAIGRGAPGLIGGLTVYALAYYALGWFVMRDEVRTLWILLRSELRDGRAPR